MKNPSPQIRILVQYMYYEISLTFNEQNIYFNFSLIIPTQIHTWRQRWQNYMLSVHRISQTITELKSSVYPISQHITEWRENPLNMLQLNMQVYFKHNLARMLLKSERLKVIKLVFLAKSADFNI